MQQPRCHAQQPTPTFERSASFGQVERSRQGRINYRNDDACSGTAPDTGYIARGDSARRKKRRRQRGSGLNGDCFSAGARSDWPADGAAGVGRVPSCGSRYYRGHLLVSGAVDEPTARAIEKDARRLRQITSTDHIDDAIARRLNSRFAAAAYVASRAVTARRCRVPPMVAAVFMAPLWRVPPFNRRSGARHASLKSAKVNYGSGRV